MLQMRLLINLPYLLNGRCMFHRDIAHTSVCENDFLIKVDIKDYLLSGQEHQLRSCALRAVESGDFRQLLDDVVNFLLLH